MSQATDNKIKKFIQEYNLIQKGDNLVVGVSGGADSMMLLHFLYTHQNEYQIQIKVAHIQHGIRDEAEEDALFVERMCALWELAYYRHNCDIKELAETNNISTEEAGRIERYNFFISLSNNSSKIVTAHTMNDQAETLIMRFLRGSDIKGLSGISPLRDQIIRPLLCIQRKEVEAYCLHNGVYYRDDHTNFLPIYTRNKIRLECIPYIEQNLNPNIIHLLGEHSNLYRESEDFLKTYTQELFAQCAESKEGNVSIDLVQFENCHKYIQRRIIILAVTKLSGNARDITWKHLESTIGLTKLQSGKKVSLPHNITAYKAYNQLIIAWPEQKRAAFKYAIDIGTYYIPEAEATIVLTLVEKQTIIQKNEKMYTKYIDYGKIKNGLQIRTRLPHDYITAKAGTKKIKKLFIDDKVPKALRDHIPLIAVEDEIIWIVGSRLSENYYITEETQKVLEIKIIFK